MRRITSLALLMSSLLGSNSGLPAAAQNAEVPFAEAFALSDDREAVLERLLPGTADAFYYRCLHLQNSGRLAEVPPLLIEWARKVGRSSRVQEIEHRQALLNIDGDREGSLGYLKQNLGLRFDHRAAGADAAIDLPSALDSDTVAYARFLADALRNNKQSFDGVTDYGLTALAGTTMRVQQRTQFLQRLQRPDLENLAELVVADLRERAGKGVTFGSLPIHARLTLGQLHTVAAALPQVRNDNEWVAAVLARLAPNDDAFHGDAAVRDAHLTRLEGFVTGLGAQHNSLKAHVLFHRLKLGLEQGQPNERSFKAYLGLPRTGGWVNPRRRERANPGQQVNLRQDFATRLPQIGDDQSLIRACLEHFLRDASSTSAYAELMDADYLRRIFAETKILSGADNRDRWLRDLGGAAEFERLRERVEIEFAPTQAQHFGADASVSIALRLKNVPSLLIKVFEIDAENYYRSTGGEVDASIALDGLVPNVERSFAGDTDPLLRYEQTFEFPELSNAGVFVVEFVGNGLSSRAVIFKGALTATMRSGSAGQVIQVFDENGVQQTAASLLLDNRAFDADKSGDILVPFGTTDSNRTALISVDGVASVYRFRHLAERIELALGATVEREQLLAFGRAKMILRPDLRIGGVHAHPSLLIDPVLRLVATDVRGIATSVEVRDLEMTAAGDLVHEFQVPADLVTVQATLSGKVQEVSTGEDKAVDANASAFTLNGILSTSERYAPILIPSSDGYAIDVLGRNGEPLVGAPVRLEFWHRSFTRPVTVTLATDANGRVTLGQLPGIARVQFSGLPPGRGMWELETDQLTLRTTIQGVAGNTVRVPLLDLEAVVSRAEFSLFELRDGAYCVDRFNALQASAGFLNLVGLAAGDYELFLKRADQGISIHVAGKSLRPGLAGGGSRLLRLPFEGLQIAALDWTNKDLTVRVANASPNARVHVLVARSHPTYDAYGGLALRGVSEELAVSAARSESTYHSGREIGDEYRYILARRRATVFPGVMLPRPGVLLNPWALEEQNDVIGIGGGAGGKFGGRSGGKRNLRAGGGPVGPRTAVPTPGLFGSLDFVSDQSVALTNLKPDSDGVVRISASDLGSGQCVRVVAVDRGDTVQRTVLRKEQSRILVDQRLTDALPADGHSLQVRRIEFVRAGQQVELAAAAGTKAETFDTLASVYQLYRTLSNDSELAKFSFLLGWPDLDAEEKGELYSEFACHELHLFLYMKDRAFFDDVVRPYLSNKLDTTFLDEWLLDRDIERFLEPYAFAQLNIVERILLARRITDRGESVGRHLRDLVAVMPPDPLGDAHRFDQILAGDGLGGGGALRRELGEAQQLERSRKASKSKRRQGELEARVATGNEPSAGFFYEDEGVEMEEVELEKLEQNSAAAAPSAELADSLTEDSAGSTFFLGTGVRRSIAPLYRAPSATKAYVENNYWQRRIEEQNSNLVGPNRFWRDFAVAPLGQPFVSPAFAEATGNFAEMLMALAVLDLPFVAGEHAIETTEGQLQMTAASSLLMARKELATAPLDLDGAILVGQQFVALDDRYEQVDGEQREKQVRGEYVVGRPYSCRVVATNPTSTPIQLDVLTQVPAGSMPLQGGLQTRSVTLNLGAFGTASHEFAFYFPEPGDYGHFPAHAARDGKLVALGVPVSMNVVEFATEVDTSSWNYVADRGSDSDVLNYLRDESVLRVDLDRIAWRMKERSFYDSAIAQLDSRFVYSPTLWGYAFQHSDRTRERQYMENATRYLDRCGAYLDSPLVTIDPVERRSFQIIEFAPLMHARAHPFGNGPRITHAGLGAQVSRMYDVLAHRPQLDNDDWLTVTTAYLMQDRFSEAVASFARVDRTGTMAKLQYDYVDAVLAMVQSDVARARQIAEQHVAHPVERWRSRFQETLAQIAEVTGENGRPGATDSDASQLVASEPTLELEFDGDEIRVLHDNLEVCELAFYQTDVEFLFSSQPFEANQANGGSFVRPNERQTLVLAPGVESTIVNLPLDLEAENLVIEVRSGGLVRRRARYASDVSVQMVESQGQLRASRAGQPLSAAYVKVYARFEDGGTGFHKDGYTDLRGRFDYMSLTGPDGRAIHRFAILVLHPEHGAVVREVAPPTM